jgi:uncharacterized RmlC-like cupin family protein
MFNLRRCEMTKQCVLIRTGQAAEGKTGVTYAAGVSAATAGARALCLQLASLPPGTHLHAEHESAAYVIEGGLVLWFGERLEERVAAGSGDFLYIPRGVPHLVANASDSQPVVTVLARSDPNQQESVTELPQLDALPHLRPGQPA